MEPHLIASAGLIALAGLLSMLATLRALDTPAPATMVQGRLAAVAAYDGTTPRMLGRTLVAVCAGGAWMVVASAGVRHSWNSRHTILPAATAGLLVLLVVVAWLLGAGTARRLADRGITPYLVPALSVAAGPGLTPFAAVRLWSDQGGVYSGLVIPERTWFDPEAGGLGALAGCLLMVAAGGALLVLRVAARRRRSVAV